jgi:hypothetical protein
MQGACNPNPAWCLRAEASGLRRIWTHFPRQVFLSFDHWLRPAGADSRPPPLRTVDESAKRFPQISTHRPADVARRGLELCSGLQLWSPSPLGPGE